MSPSSPSTWHDGGAYATWTGYLSRWGAGTAVLHEELPHLQQADFSEQTWARLADHLVRALSGRLEAWAKALSTAIAATSSAFGFGAALADARTGLTGVLEVAGHPGLPPELREKLRELVERQVRQAQADLERGVEELRTRGVPSSVVDERRRAVRSNRFTAVLDAPHLPAPATPRATPTWSAPGPGASDPTAVPRRRIVVD